MAQFQKTRSVPPERERRGLYIFSLALSQFADDKRTMYILITKLMIYFSDGQVGNTHPTTQP